MGWPRHGIVHAAGGRANLVLVVLSLGAFTAPLVCARLSVQMLILPNPMISNPNETPGEWWANGRGTQAAAACARTDAVARLP